MVEEWVKFTEAFFQFKNGGGEGVEDFSVILAHSLRKQLSFLCIYCIVIFEAPINTCILIDGIYSLIKLIFSLGK